MTTSRIAALLHISKQGGAQVVNDMQRRGYVEGHPDPTDGRARLLHLAPRGRNALVAARAFHRRHEETLEGMIGKEHVAILRAALYMIARGDGTQEPDTLTPYM
jgi:DNA-binding MarR family transcriptional regulator